MVAITFLYWANNKVTRSRVVSHDCRYGGWACDAVDTILWVFDQCFRNHAVFYSRWLVNRFLIHNPRAQLFHDIKWRTYSDLLRGSAWSLSVARGVLPVDVSGLRDLLSSDPTAVFTKLSKRPAELVAVVEVTLVLDTGRDWKTLSLEPVTWDETTAYTSKKSHNVHNYTHICKRSIMALPVSLLTGGTSESLV